MKINISNKLSISIMYLVLFTLAVMSFSFQAQAILVLDSVQYDPAIISSGDEVDIVVQYHEVGGTISRERLASAEYDFHVRLLPDDTISKEYLIFQNSEGSDLHGSLISGSMYNKRYRIKVAQNAPPGNYQLRLEGQWYHNDLPLEGLVFTTFMMPVKKEGVSLAISNIISDPERIRAGDKNILLKAEVTNSGEKLAKNIQLKLRYPEGIISAYTNNNQVTLGVVDAMQKQSVQFFIDTAKDIKEGIYEINYTLSYQDVDSNSYTYESSFPVVIKKKPRIIVKDYEGVGLAGDSALIHVTLENVGEEKSDAVDVRIIKQSSQPFDMDVRSEYLGQIKSGDIAQAVFNVHILPDAEIKNHTLNLMIRAKGDSEEGDTGIYTYSDSITLEVTGKKNNPYPLFAAIFAGIVIIGIIISVIRKKK